MSIKLTHPMITGVSWHGVSYAKKDGVFTVPTEAATELCTVLGFIPAPVVDHHDDPLAGDVGQGADPTGPDAPEPPPSEEHDLPTSTKRHKNARG